MELIKELKQSKIIKSVFIALIGSVLLAISSKIKIPFYPVPMTMQTLVVLLLGILLGWKLGLATVALYLFEGIIGLPVFSGSPEKGIGIIYFTGPTMGYLIGFLFAVYFAGRFKLKENFFTNLFQLIFSVSFIYILGTSLFVFLDAVKEKSRMFVLVVVFFFALITLYSLYQRIFTFI